MSTSETHHLSFAFRRGVSLRSIHPTGSEQRGAGGSRRRLLRCIERWRNGSARSCPLRAEIHGVERLARGHEQAGAVGTAEAEFPTHLGRADAAEERAGRRPPCPAVIAEGAAGIARAPDIAVDTA